MPAMGLILYYFVFNASSLPIVPNPDYVVLRSNLVTPFFSVLKFSIGKTLKAKMPTSRDPMFYASY